MVTTAAASPIHLISMKQNINEEIKKIKHMMGLNENVAVNSLDDFPEELKRTFLNNYLHLVKYYDHNVKSDKFTDRVNRTYDGAGFRKWVDNHYVEQFAKSKRRIMAAVTEDFIDLKRKMYFRKKAEEYENELKDLFGFHIIGYHEEVGDHISDSVFRKFVEERPKYKKYYDKWVKLRDEYHKYILKNYNSSVNVPSYADIRKIYNFLKTGKTT